MKLVAHKIHPWVRRAVEWMATPWVAEVKIEFKEKKNDTRMGLVAGEGRGRKNKFFFVFKITGKLGSKITTAKPSLDG